MKLTKEIKTALLVLGAIFLVIFGYNFLKGQNILGSSREIYAVYDNVEELSNSANVRINGKDIGSVTDISFLENSEKLVVTMRIKNDFKFSKNSIAKLYSDGLISGKSVKIIPDYNAENAESGDTLKSEVESDIIADVTERLKPLEKKVSSALTEMDTFLKNLNNVLGDSGQKDLKESFTHLNSSLENLENSTTKIDNLLSHNSERLDTTIGNLDKTTYNFSKVSDSLAQIEVQSLTAKLDKVLNDFEAISTKLNDGEGTAGKLLHDDEVYNNLNRSTKQLDELLEDIKLNPRRYVNLKFSIFGGKNKTEPYKNPKDSSE